MQLNKKQLLTLLFFFSLCCNIFSSQNLVKIHGKIKSSDNEIVNYGLIRVKNTNTVALISSKGEYEFNLKPGNYTFVVNVVGYENIEKNFDIKGGKTIRHNFTINPEVYQLDEFVAKAKSPIAKIKESAYNAIAIDAKALHNSSLDIGGALDRVSGIKVRADGGEGSDVSFSMNGFSGKHIRFFIDGVPMEGFGESFKISNLPITLVDRIEVYKGVVPVEFGSDALGGVVNIITNKAKRTTIDASFGYGSFNTIKSNVNLNKVFGNKMVLQLNAFQNYSDNNYKVMAPVKDLKSGIYSAPREVRRFNDQFRNATVIAKFGVQDKKYADRLLFGFTYGEGKKGIQTGTEMKRVFGEKSRNSTTIMPSFEYSKRDLFVPGLTVGLTANYNMGHTQHVDTATHSYNWAGERATKLTVGESGSGASIVKIFNNNASSTLNISYRMFEKHTLSMNNVFYYFNRKTENPLAIKDTEADKNSELKRISLKNISSLSYKIDVLENLSFSAFGKSYSTSHIFDGRPSKSSNTGYGAAGTFTHKDIQLKTSFEKTYRLPSNREMFGDGDMERGNEKLRPEQGNNLNVNLGYSTVFYKSHSLFIDGGFAYRKMKDYIKRSIYRGGSSAESENIGGVESSGFNIEGRYIYKDLFQLGGTLTAQKILNKQEFISGNFGIKNPYFDEKMPNEPYLFATADAAWTIRDLLQKGNKLLLGYNMRYIYKYTYDFESIGAESTWIPTQFVHDLSVSYGILRNSLHFTLEANNITNEKVYDNYSFQKPGRNFMFKIRYLYN